MRTLESGSQEEKKILRYLGLAARGRLLVSGEQAVGDTVSRRRAKLVIIASDTSENSMKKAVSMCEASGTPYIVISDKEELGRTLGKAIRSLAAVTDANIADAITKVSG